MEEAPPLPDPLPVLARELTEALCRFLRCEQGRWRVDFVFNDGKLEKFTRQHGPVGTNVLAAFAEDVA